MRMQHYQLRISGLSEEKGQIKAADLKRVLDALIKTAKCTTRLLVTGRGSGRKGKEPKWLNAAVDFTITGLHAGSTAFGVAVPELRETGHKEFLQSFSNGNSYDNDTSLDLVAKAIDEAQTDNYNGDYNDPSVLKAILEFGNAVKESDVRYELIPFSDTHKHFILDRRICTLVEWRLDENPAQRLHEASAPIAFTVRGKLNEIQHESRHFRLLKKDGSDLLGWIASSQEVENLRFLWGKDVVVEGMLHFGDGGKQSEIEAQRIELVQEKLVQEESVDQSRTKIDDLLSSDFVGCAEGPEDLAERYKQYLTEGLEGKHGTS